MPEISQITLPSGTTYDIKDAQARRAKGWIGITTTAIEDGDNTNPITIDGQSVTATAGDITAYGDAEFIWNGSVWQAFGDLSDLGALAYKNSASGTFTPQGSVSAPTITPTIASVPNVTSVGNMPTFTVTNEVLTISAGSTPSLGTPIDVMTGAAASQPTFTGTAGTVTVS